MKISPSSSLSSTSDPPLSSRSSDLQDHLTVEPASLSIGTDQGIIGLGQDTYLFNLVGDGMSPPVMGVQSTVLIHDDKQLLGKPTGKSVDVSDVPTRFSSAGNLIDTASFANDIAQGYDGNFADNSLVLAITSILPRPLTDPISVAATYVSFSDDMVGNIVNTAFGAV